VADRVGQQLGNYRLVRLLGQGGFAEVYLGEHIHLDTPAAIKVLQTQLDSEDIGQFHTEARIIARLIHPHIVRVLDYGVTGTTPFLVMDYAPHSTLRKRYPKGALLPLSTVASYVTQLADALQYAHEQKVIHRDVKPENMLLGRRYEVLLSDFGIALVGKSSRHYSTQGLPDLAGTIAYMAPEQIQAQACPNSDQYSLGIVVYEWLSGMRPFQGTFTEVAVKHTLAPPPSLRKIVPMLPAEVEEVVMKALDKDPTRRFASVQEFAIAFEQAYRQGPKPPEQPQESSPPFPAPTSDITVSPGQPPVQEAALQSTREGYATVLFSAPDLPSTSGLAPYEPSPPPGETSTLDQALASTQSSQLPSRGIARRRLLQGLAGVGLASAVGGGIALLRYAQGARNAATSHGPTIGVGTTLFTYRGHNDWVWSVAWSPDGKRIASASGDKTAQVWDALDGDHLNRYSGHAASVYAVAWNSIRGTAALPVERIASASYDKTVQIWDPVFGDHFYTYTGHTDWVWSVAWSHDGRRIASAGGDKTVQVWDAADGGHVYTFRGHAAPVYAVAWSPDGKHIASSSADGTVQVWDATHGIHLYTFQPYSTSIWSVAWSPDGRRIASACDNKTVQVWDAANGDHLYIYYGHSDFVYAAAWSPDGKHIASAGDDKTVQVWDAMNGNLFYSYTGHSHSVRTIAWSPDSKSIASGSWDKTVQVWRAG
jgi:WD40 repeat protein/serine/threonine protein kinase